MKTLSLKITLLVIGISVLSGCYTQLSEPISREEYYTEEEYNTNQDTIYQYQEDLSEYNLGYRDGLREYMNNNLWYGYNPNSYFYSGYRPNRNSYWDYNHSFYLGVYDPYFYDPFWDWGYASYYSPYNYYGYNGWYNYPYSRHYYSHGYYYHHPAYYHSGYANTKKVSEGREQMSANREPIGTTPSVSKASRSSVSSNSDFQSSMNLPMAASRGGSSAISSSSSNKTENQQISVLQTGRAVRNAQSKTSSYENVPGFQNTLVPPVKPETRTVKTRSVSNSRVKRTTTVPIKRSPSSNTSTPSSKSSSSSSSDTKSSSGSSQSRYSAPSKTSSNSSSSNSSSGTRSTNSSSSRSSSSSDRSSKKKN